VDFVVRETEQRVIKPTHLRSFFVNDNYGYYFITFYFIIMFFFCK